MRRPSKWTSGARAAAKPLVRITGSAIGSAGSTATIRLRSGNCHLRASASGAATSVKISRSGGGSGAGSRAAMTASTPATVTPSSTAPPTRLAIAYPSAPPPAGSVTRSTCRAGTDSSTWVVPDGHRISIRSTVSAVPSPK